MGYCYRFGYGVTRDYVQAFTWFKKSAEGGYSWSMGELGHYYYFGRSVAKNYSSALTWYRKGAEAGCKMSTDLRRSLGKTWKMRIG